MLQDNRFTMQTDDMLAEEIKTLITGLDDITSTVRSDHIMNLLEEVSGKLPDDKAKMLAVVQNYQALSELDRLIFRTGRRGGTYRSTDDLQRDPETYAKIKHLIEEIQDQNGPEAVETFLTEMVDRYI